jgi:F420H(2)-dependent quinone reductase
VSPPPALRTGESFAKDGKCRLAGPDFGENAVMPVRSFDDANAFHRTMRAFAATKVGRVLFRPTAHHLDQLVSKLTGGKRSFAGIAAGLPTVILTTTGAKSGKPRTVALLGIPHPDGVAVVATNYGGAKHPACTTISRPTQRPQ